MQLKKNSNLKEHKIKNYINFEERNKIYSVNYYKKMMIKINYKKKKLLRKISKLINLGFTISGIGRRCKI